MVKKKVVENLKLNDQGLIPAIVQDYKTGEVLMLAYMSPESLKLTLKDKKNWFYSRSRKNSGLREKPQVIFKKLRKCILIVIMIPF